MLFIKHAILYGHLFVGMVEMSQKRNMEVRNNKEKLIIKIHRNEREI